jgi:beta-carotene hydroxylase
MSAITRPAERPYAATAAQIMRQEMGRIVWPTAIASVIIFLAYGLTLYLALSGSIPLLLGTVLAFICIHPSAAVLHEASHRAVSSGAKGLRWLDDVIGYVHGLMLTYDFGIFRFLHLRHHQHTNDPAADPDYWMQGRRPLVIFYLAMFSPLHYLRLFIELARRGLVPRREMLWATARVLAIVITIIALMVVAPGKTFLLWVFPASVASGIVNLSHSMLHRPVVSADRRMTTLIVRGERFWEWVVSPFFWLNNHHFLHHEFPRAPFTAHARMFREFEGQLRADGVQILTVGQQPPRQEVRTGASA